MALVAPVPGLAATSDEACFQAAVNAERANAGLPALTLDPVLVQVAQGWVATLESGGVLENNPYLAAQTPEAWGLVGENVGLGPSCSSVATAFFNSPEHRANILDPSYLVIGVGAITAPDGELYVAEDFAGEYTGAGASPPVPAVVQTPPAVVAPVPTPPPAVAALTAPVGSIPVSSTPVGTPPAPHNPVAPARKSSSGGRMMIEVFSHLSASGAVVAISAPAPPPAAKVSSARAGTTLAAGKASLVRRLGHDLRHLFSHIGKRTPHASIAPASPAGVPSGTRE